MSEDNKIYVGDGVYAEWTGYSLILTTSNGLQDTDTIHLEPWMLKVLKALVDRFQEGEK